MTYTDDGDLAMIRLLDEVVDHVGMLKARYPPGFPCTRNDLRLGIAALQDEAQELRDEWQIRKRHLDAPSARAALEAEAFDAIAVGMLIIQGLRGIYP